MDTIKLKGFVNHSRQLTMELPPSFPTGEVEITVQAPLELYISHGSHSWSEPDLDALFEFKATKARNLVVGGWSTNAKKTQTIRQVEAKR